MGLLLLCGWESLLIGGGAVEDGEGRRRDCLPYLAAAALPGTDKEDGGDARKRWESDRESRASFCLAVAVQEMHRDDVAAEDYGSLVGD